VFYSFDSEGNVAQRSDTGSSVSSSHLFGAHESLLVGSLNDPFGYKAQFGYYSDNETGLLLLTHRYYDPVSGRFLTSDPIGYEGGINLYAAVTNKPINLADPTGTKVSDADKVAALKKIGDATGSWLDKDWRLWPGSKSIRDSRDNLRKMGFKPFFNPGHWGGSDWEGQIDGNWYHVIVGYPKPKGPSDPRFGSPCDRPPSFVDAHYEHHQPSSLQHLIDWAWSWY
jgi:RHS repeat-associated protein